MAASTMIYDLYVSIFIHSEVTIQYLNIICKLFFL